MVISILLTGGLGFVGLAVVTALRNSHPEWLLFVLDLQQPIDTKPGVVYRQCDITNFKALENLVADIKPSVVIHTAGIVPDLVDRYDRKGRARVFQVNVDGTRNMLAAAKSNDVKAFIWTGSCTSVTDDLSRQYPNIDESWPLSSHSLIYGESKVSLKSLVL